jgi:predicted phage-related endonuclease
MLVSRRSFGYIGALVGGNKTVLIRRDADRELHNIMMEEVGMFWKSIEENTPPIPDFSKEAAFLISLRKYSEPGKIIDADERVTKLAEGYKKVADTISGLEKEKDKFKAMILELVGDAEKVKGETFSISAGTVGEAHIDYIRKPYRNFRISWKGQKGAKDE